MKTAIVTIEIEVQLEVDNSTTIEEAKQIALFECEAISSIGTDVFTKMDDRDVIGHEVTNAEFID